MALSAMMLAAVSCNKPEPEPEPGPDSSDPTVAITGVTPSVDAITFTLNPKNAETVAWLAVEAGTELPDGPAIIADGHEADTSVAEYTADGLKPATEYVILAVACKGDIYSKVASAEATTLEGEVPAVPEVTVEITKATRSAVTFAYTQAGAERMAYVISDAADGLTAEQILAEGTELDINGSEAVAEGLSANTDYTVAVAAVSGDVYSEVAMADVTTMKGFMMDYDATDIVFATVSASVISGTSADSKHKLSAVFDNGSGTTFTTELWCALGADGILPDGTYTVGSGEEVLTMVPGKIWSAIEFQGSVLTVAGDPNEYGAAVSGTMTVSGDRIVFDMVINDDYAFTGSFAGEVKVAFESQIGSDLTEDYHAEFDLSGSSDYFTAYSWIEDGFVRFIINDYEGDNFQAEILWNTPVVPTGTFTAATGAAGETGTFKIGRASLTGIIEGTGLCIRDEGFQYGQQGYHGAPAYSGEITVTDNNDGTWTLSFDLYDDIGHNFTGSYTGEMGTMWF